MSTASRTVLITSVLLALALPARAGQAPIAVGQSGFSKLFPPPSRQGSGPAQAPVPFRFSIPSDTLEKARRTATEAMRAVQNSAPPKVVCGMRMVPVDPSYDAAIRREPPSNPVPTPMGVTPPACAPGR